MNYYRHKPQFGFGFGELIVDNFAGGGGASTGIEMATGRAVDIAINHDKTAIAMHTVNHPTTTHYNESVWDVDPRKLVDGRPVGLAWFSPDCRHFSKAKGSAPVSKQVRGLAWVVLKWAGTVKPRIIILENVEEFLTWGPLTTDEKGNLVPCPKRKGQTFKAFINAIKRQGYNVEWKELRACDYGAPTIRKRLFLIARCDGQPICWPEPTHGKGLKPYKTAASIIDWSLPCPSIFTRKKPLAENTLKRIAEGLKRHVFEAKKPFIIKSNASFLTECANASGHRSFDLNEPLRTQCANVKGGHFALVSAFLMKYYGTSNNGQSLREPLHTITTKERYGLVTIKGQDYQIVDIGMRMLQPHELYAAQGFPKNYQFTHRADGTPITKTEQIAKCGNSVCPPVASAIVKANYSEAHGAIAI